MFSKDIGIDLGTANILINIRGEGIVLNEPSVLAIDEESKKVLAVGLDAYDMLGRTPGKIKALRPLKDGVIANFELTEIMLNYFIKKVKAKNIFCKPRILICCPTNVTEVEKNAIKEAAERIGARKVYIEEEPKVAAIGAGLDISKPNGSMIVDIGGGTTDIAVLSLGEIVTSKSIKNAGTTFDNEIVNYVKENYDLLIGEITAEEVKKKIGVVFDIVKKEKMNIRGRNLINGLPYTISISNEEVRKALEPSIKKIILTIKQLLEITPPELSGDIINKGIVVTGGGALLRGLDKLLEKELNVPIYIAKNPLTCVAEGTGIMLENFKNIK